MTGNEIVARVAGKELLQVAGLIEELRRAADPDLHARLEELREKLDPVMDAGNNPHQESELRDQISRTAENLDAKVRGGWWVIALTEYATEADAIEKLAP